MKPLALCCALGAVIFTVAAMLDPSVVGSWVKSSAACVIGLVGIGVLIRGEAQ